jgi:hypothetical protein
MRLLLLALVLPVIACANTDEGRVNAETAPSGDAFRPVAQVLVDRCGSLDCHGSKYRNMHLWGFGSSRIDASALPDSPETTSDEVDLDYQAVVSLEPDRFREVIADGGRNPERLTFFRKGQLMEAHKGGQRIVPGDPADVCVRSWLASSVDAAACKAAVPRLAAQ